MAYDNERPPLTDGTEIGEVRGHYRWSGVRWILIDGATVGEVRDGYRWNGTKWVPVDGTRVGEVRDGYRWTGTQWVPVADNDRYDDRNKKDEDKKKLAIALGTLAAIILLGLLIWWIVDMNNDDDDQPAVEPTPIASIGTAVQEGDLEFTVLALRPDVEAVGVAPNVVTADGSYTLVTLRVTNNSGDPVGFSDSQVDAIDTNDNTLDAVEEADAYTANGGPAFDGDIAANDTITTVVAFDVADDATLDKIVVHEPESSDGQEIDVS